MKKTILFFCVALLCATHIGAYNVQIDGVYYNLNHVNLTAQVTYGDVNYSGDVIVPQTLLYEGRQYTVTSIGYQAFSNASWNLLKSLSLPETIEEIESEAFAYMGIGLKLTIPKNVKKIGHEAFGWNRCDTIIFNAKCVKDFGQLWYDCSTKVIIIGPDVDTIPANMFADLGRLEEVEMHENVKYVGSNAINRSRLKKPVYSSKILVAVPKNYNTNYTILPTTEKICAYTFSDCSALPLVTIPNSVTTIGDYAFYNCSCLTSVTCYATTPPICGNNCFYNVNKSIPVYVPAQSVDAYKQAERWKDFNNLQGFSLDSMFIYQDCNKNGLIVNSSNSMDMFAYVDLGLSVKWATMNIGATTPEDSGIKFAWGETQTKEEFDWTNYRYCNGTANTMTKYNNNSAYGEVDSKTTLDLLDDAAFVNWGSNWRMPTYAELSELINNCQWTWITQNNFEGYKITSKINGKSILLPHNGWASYWTSSLYEQVPNNGWVVSLTSYGIFTNHGGTDYRYDGRYVRPVTTQSSNNSTLSVYANGCSKPNVISCATGRTITITAVPENGYQFTQWSDGNTDNPRAIQVLEDTTFTAEFAKKQYLISVEIEHGEVSGIGTYDYGSEISLIVTPSYGYQFTQWSDGNTDNPRSFVVTQDTIFTAQIDTIWSGACGGDLTWRYNDGVLVISGTGAMYDYTQGTAPWMPLFQESISSLVINNGCTSIGDFAFYGLSNKNFKTIDIPNGVEQIGQFAFANCEYIKNVYLGLSLEKISANAFANDERLLYITCYAIEPPLLDESAFVNYDAYLSVPCASLADYKVAKGWKLFNKENVSCIGAEEKPITSDEVTVTPSTDNATIVWPANDDAAEYTLEITKDGVVFCTLRFNAQGQLIGIAFVSSRDGELRTMSNAEMTINGWSFTVTGLNPGSTYSYTVDVIDAQKQSIRQYTGSFTTTGGVVTSLPTLMSTSTSGKVLYNGHLYILRGDNLYTATGARVK